MNTKTTITFKGSDTEITTILKEKVETNKKLYDALRAEADTLIATAVPKRKAHILFWRILTPTLFIGAIMANCILIENAMIRNTGTLMLFFMGAIVTYFCFSISKNSICIDPLIQEIEEKKDVAIFEKAYQNSLHVYESYNELNQAKKIIDVEADSSEDIHALLSIKYSDHTGIVKTLTLPFNLLQNTEIETIEIDFLKQLLIVPYRPTGELWPARVKAF